MSAGQVSAHGEEGPSRPAVTAPPTPRPLFTIAVFALVGPLVGLLVFQIVVWFLLWLPPVWPSRLPRPTFYEFYKWMKIALHPFFVMLAYWFFGIPALLVGIGNVAADRWAPSSGRRYLAAALIGAAFASSFVLLFWALEVRATPAHIISPGLDDWLLGQLPFLPVGALAALVCAYLTRRWRYNRA